MPGLQADCSATARSLEEEIAAKQAELADVTAEQAAREAQATDLDRQLADTERRLQVWHAETHSLRIMHIDLGDVSMFHAASRRVLSTLRNFGCRVRDFSQALRVCI